MKKTMIMMLLLVGFLAGLLTNCAATPIPPTPTGKKGELTITEENFHLLQGQWVGLVKLFTIKSGVFKENASLDINISDRKMVLFIGRSNIFEGIAFKDGCLFSEKKETGEWIKVALEDGKLWVEFKIKNKNPKLPNINGEGSFVRYQN
ncbi:MAG: hypothetical protein Q8N42_01835 [bacterium]|nr:hypothetical protein [bacterium]